MSLDDFPTGWDWLVVVAQLAAIVIFVFAIGFLSCYVSLRLGWF